MAKLDDTVLAQAKAMLDELGIVAILHNENYLTIDRTSMCQSFPSNGDEHDSYQLVLDWLQEQFPMHRVMWSGRTDEWLGVDFYI